LDAGNVAKRFKPKNPLLIGNEKMALAVYQCIRHNDKTLSTKSLAAETASVTLLDKFEE
jgi:hypothetical protein